MTTSRQSGVYSTLVEDRMRALFRSLSEKDALLLWRLLNSGTAESLVWPDCLDVAAS